MYTHVPKHARKWSGRMGGRIDLEESWMLKETMHKPQTHTRLSPVLLVTHKQRPRTPLREGLNA